MKKRNYGLFTAITMISGIVIGSGIFFKSHTILAFANGNVLVGVLLWTVAAIAIIFGSLSLSQLATRTDKPGGLVTYAEDFVGMGTSCMFGWFQTFLYMPTLTAIVAFVSGSFVCQLFGLEATMLRMTAIGFAVIVGLFIINALSARLGGLFQNASLIIKLVPLFVLAACGLIFGQPAEVVVSSAATFKTAATLGILAAFGPIAFSFDGWVLSTSICHEIKNSKRNLPLALILAPIAILVAYLLYFVGVNAILGPDMVMQLGNAVPYTIAAQFFGDIGAKIVLVTVVISVIGTVNGVVLASVRMPYSLGLRNMMPFANRAFAKTSEKFGDMPINSSLLMFALSIFWLAVHYFVSSAGLGIDISEIAIGVSYALYIILYIAVMRLCKKGEIKSKFMGYVVPTLATIGSLIILSGSVTNKLFPLYLGICVVVLGGAYLYYHRNKQRITPTEPLDD